MKKFLFLSLVFCLFSCAPKTETKTIYLDKVKFVMPELPNSMTEPIKPANNPSKNTLEMTHNDLVKWWAEIRYNLQEANQKLLKIRVWYNQQLDVVNKQNLESEEMK